MKNLIYTFLFLIFGFSFSFGQKTDKALSKVLMKNRSLKPILQNAEKYKIQILYTPIKNGKTGKTLAFRHNESEYFYPASTIKLPAVLLSLEKLNNLKEINKDTPLRIVSSLKNYEGVDFDSSSVRNYASIAQYARKILVVSDNDAYNRLYDFLGPKYFNEQMTAKGFGNFRANHRLSISLPSEVNASKPAVFFGAYEAKPNLPSFANTDRMEIASFKTIYKEEAALNEYISPSTKLTPIGNGYYVGDQLVKSPMDFSGKNQYGLASQHLTLKSLFFPNDVPSSQRFNLSGEDISFVKKYMSIMPRNCESPLYPEGEYFDSYAKFFIYGDQKIRMPEDVKIYNKIGEAYGFLIDNAYITDSKNNVSFILSAVIYVNEDGILNDDKYEYEEVGIPFLAELGRTIYNWELKKN